MHVVAVLAPYASRVHPRRDEFVALHPVLVRAAIGKKEEIGLAGVRLVQPPHGAQASAGVIADRPVVIASFDWIGNRLTLRVAADADVVRLHRTDPRGVDDVPAGIRGVLAAGPMT